MKIGAPTPPSISKNTFKDVNACTFWIPKGCATLYKADKVWSKLDTVKEQEL